MITWQTDEKRLLHLYTKCTNMATPHVMLPGIVIIFYAETNNWHWNKLTKNFSCKNVTLITEMWQQYPAADDYHACTLMKCFLIFRPGS